MRPGRWRTGRGDTLRDRGAAAVEFAIVLTVLLVIIFGIIDFGRLLYVKQGLSAASREGARAAAVGETGTDVLERVTQAATATEKLSASGALRVTYGTEADTEPNLVLTSAAPCGANQEVTVRVATDFNWLTPIGALTGGVFLQQDQPIGGSTTMRCET